MQEAHKWEPSDADHTPENTIAAEPAAGKACGTQTEGKKRPGTPN